MGKKINANEFKSFPYPKDGKFALIDYEFTDEEVANLASIVAKILIFCHDTGKDQASKEHLVLLDEAMVYDKLEKCVQLCTIKEEDVCNDGDKIFKAKFPETSDKSVQVLEPVTATGS